MQHHCRGMGTPSPDRPQGHNPSAGAHGRRGQARTSRDRLGLTSASVANARAPTTLGGAVATTSSTSSVRYTHAPRAHSVMIRRTRDHPLGWMFLTMGTVAAGAIGWVIDVALLWTLAAGLGVPTPIAAACGLTASGVVNFLVNRVVHGGAEAHRRRELARYMALFGVNLVITAVSVPLIAGLLSRVVADRGLQLLGAKVVVTAALLLVNTYAYHRWVFRPTPMMTDPGAP